jgi:hypothetical protein
MHIRTLPTILAKDSMYNHHQAIASIIHTLKVILLKAITTRKKGYPQRMGFGYL